MNTTARNTTVHQGRNIKRFREMLGIKQEALAHDLGDDWSQKKVSLLEAKEEIEPAILQQVSALLRIPVEAIERFDEEQAVSFISNTINNNDNATMHAPSLYNYYPSFNPLDKVIELYERMLQDKQDIIQRLEALWNDSKARL